MLAGEPQPERSGQAVLVEGQHGHVRLDGCDQQRVVDQVPAREPARAHPLERDGLGRGAVLVRIDSDLAEKDPVGPRDRLLPKRHGLATGVAVGERPQAPPDVRRTRARARLDRHVQETKLRKLDREVLGDPANLDLGLDHNGRAPRGWRTRART